MKVSRAAHCVEVFSRCIDIHVCVCVCAQVYGTCFVDWCCGNSIQAQREGEAGLVKLLEERVAELQRELDRESQEQQKGVHLVTVSLREDVARLQVVLRVLSPLALFKLLFGTLVCPLCSSGSVMTTHSSTR